MRFENWLTMNFRATYLLSLNSAKSASLSVTSVSKVLLALLVPTSLSNPDIEPVVFELLEENVSEA